MITSAALKNGFTGGLIVDYPNSQKAKKYYLFLMAGYSEEIMNEAKQVIMPRAKTGDSDDEEDSDDNDESDDEDEEDKIDVRGNKKNKGIKKKEKFVRNDKSKVKDKRWIMKKKERQRKQGKNVCRDSKYSGRKRPSGFH